MSVPFAPKFADLVRTTTATLGTGPFVPGSAVPGFTSFSDALQRGDRFYYCAQNSARPNEREVGRGTLMPDGSIAREPIDGDLTSFTAGPKTIALVAAAEWYSQTGGDRTAEVPLAADRTALTMLHAAEGAPALLTEEGREGSFIYHARDCSAQVAADSHEGLFVAPALRSGETRRGELGAWCRVVDGSVNVRWFGAKGDNVSADGPAFVAAIAAMRVMRATNRNYGYSDALPVLFVPSGQYQLGTSTLDIDLAMTIEGVMPSMQNGGGSVLHWAAGVTGIRVQGWNTIGGYDAHAGNGYSGIGTSIRNLSLVGSLDGSDSEAHGVHLRSKARLQNLFIDRFNGDGVHGDTYSVVANINGTCLDNVFIGNCRTGIYLRGSDANNVIMVNPHVFGCRAYGIWIRDTLGSQIIGGDLSTNGQTAARPSICSYEGKHYQVLPRQEEWCRANPPSGTRAGNRGWHFLDEGQPTAARPAWDSGANFSEGGCLRIDGLSSYCTIVGLYRELDQGPAHIDNSPTVVIGGLLEAIAFDGTQYGAHLCGDASGIVAPTGFTVRKTLTVRGNVEYGPLASDPPANFLGTIKTNASYAGLNFQHTNGNYMGGFAGHWDGMQLNCGAGGYAVYHNYGLLMNWDARGISMSAGKNLRVAGTQVIGEQQAAVADATDSASAVTQLNALLSRLRSHGLIAP